jgi:nucleoside-diphosphate-sugar epimerase
MVAEGEFDRMDKSCLVIGSSSQIGSWLVPKLIKQGWTIHLASRGLSPQGDYESGANWHRFDLTDPHQPLPRMNADLLVHTAGIASILPWLDQLASVGIKRVIAFSSTSRFTKVNSTSASDLEMIAGLTRAEDELMAMCERLGLAWTIFRPTMIYGGKFGDRTVMDIVRIIRRFGFFPILGRGVGLRQPVHSDDLAEACLQSYDCPAAYNKAYNLAGEERLTYRAMVTRIFAAMGKRPRFLTVPLSVFELAVRIANLLPRYRHLTSSMAKRMNQNMVFSNDEAASDFGYNPREFSPSVVVTR